MLQDNDKCATIIPISVFILQMLYYKKLQKYCDLRGHEKVER